MTSGSRAAGSMGMKTPRASGSPCVIPQRFIASNRTDIDKRINQIKLWLGDRDSNPDQMVQSHPSYH